MRSMFMLAAFAAAISFTGCCGAGGQAGGCKLAGLFGGARTAASGQGSSASVGDCGCGAGGGAAGDCGCGAAGACGADSVVSTSEPYACDGGCGASSMPEGAPSSCGCSSCDGGGAVEHAPVESSGCSACDSASAGAARGLLKGRPERRRLIGGQEGLGLTLKGKGLACEQPRSLGSSNDSMIPSDQGVSTCDSCESCSTGSCSTGSCSTGSCSTGSCSTGSCSTGSCSADAMQTVAQMPDGFLFGRSSGERRIASGVRSGGGAVTAGGRIHSGCGKLGCIAGGKGCSTCSKLAGAAGVTHPYGGAIPHTNPAAGQQPRSGIAPQYAYPYYTTRGPRDFLVDNPPSIGY